MIAPAPRRPAADVGRAHRALDYPRPHSAAYHHLLLVALIGAKKVKTRGMAMRRFRYLRSVGLAASTTCAPPCIDSPGRFNG